MSINNTLADYFGNPTGLEKTASTLTDEDVAMWQAFEKRAAADGIDVNDDQYTDEEIDGLYEHYVNEEAGAESGYGGEQVEFPPNWSEEDVEHFSNLDEGGQETFAQFKEAEFLGEVIAHSQFSTLRKLAAAETEILEKEAGTRMGALRTTAGKVDAQVQRLGDAMGPKARANRWLRRKNKALDVADSVPSKENQGLLAKAEKMEEVAAGPDLSVGQKRLRGYGAIGAGGVGAAGGAVGVAKMLKKKKQQQEKQAAALDALAFNRAENFLKLASGEQDVEFHDFGDAEEAVDQRAAEILVENGYGELLEQ